MVLLVPLDMLKKVCLLFICSALIACNKDLNYQVKGQDLKLSDEKTCKIQHHYPQLIGLSDSLLQEGLNRYLRETTGLFAASANCIKDSVTTDLTSDYKLHLQRDTVLSIELIRKAKQANSKEIKETYFPLTVKFPEGYFLPLEFVLNERQWGKMTEYLKKWQAKWPKQRRYNEASYIWGDNDLIPYCLSSDSLILFPGGEGENQSWQRHSIALKDLE